MSRKIEMPVCSEFVRSIAIQALSPCDSAVLRTALTARSSAPYWADQGPQDLSQPQHNPALAASLGLTPTAQFVGKCRAQ